VDSVEGTAFHEHLFKVFDLDGDRTLDIKEFITGLSVLCKGSPEKKLELCFKVYDLDGNGSIDQAELAEMFRSAWRAGLRALTVTHGNEEMNPQEIEEYATESADRIAAQAFKQLDANKDGKLSFDEFCKFAMAEPKITASLKGFRQEMLLSFK